MTANECRWDGRERPRVLPRRHGDDCAGEIVTEAEGGAQYIAGCDGCLPCTEPHCRVCHRAHADQTCAECVAETRGYLHGIGRMCDALPEEVEHRGIDGEAMMLLGPVPNPEARGHLEASVLAGRVSADYIEAGVGDLHPRTILWTWEDVWRDHLDAPTTLDVTMDRLVDFLDRQLHVMAGEPLIPFEDFARDLRRCSAHLEAVLHDGEQRDTGAPCMTCGVPLERTWGTDEAADGWKCPRCRQRSTEDQYRFAVAHLHRTEATHLTDRDCQIRTGVKAGTIRVWANRGHVERKRDAGRTLYKVEDVLNHAKVVRLAS